MERTNIDLDWALKAIDPNAQQVIINSALAWAKQKQSADPLNVAPADAGRVGDEQFPAPVDAIKLINTTNTDAATIYDIEVSVAGTLDHIGVIVSNDGSVEVQPAE
jgi:hypothetical protein